MSDFLHLSLEEILAIHADQLARYGGMHGVRDQGALESALAQPQATFDGRMLHPDVFAQAAAYLFHLVKNHPFVDGNKRTGLVAALVFLHLNGIQVEASDERLVALVLEVAQSNTSKGEIASFLQEHVVASEDS